MLVYNKNKLKKDKFKRETATELVQLNKFRFFYLNEMYKYQ